MNNRTPNNRTPNNITTPHQTHDDSPSHVGAFDAAAVIAILDSPQHRAGLHDLTLEITEISQRYPWLARVTGHVQGMAGTDLNVWRHPNLAVRLAIPDSEDQLGATLGQPGLCRRVYTIAEVDTLTSTASIDIVIHGSTSPMMRWLNGLTPGDRVDFAGPRPHAAPVEVSTAPSAGGHRIHLLADGSAYPAASAIAQALQRSPENPGSPSPVATAILALPEDNPRVPRYAADFPGVGTLIAAPSSSPTPLADALASLQVAPGDTVWAAGEREDIRAVRSWCLKELGLPKTQVQVFGYWRRGKTGTDADLARLQGIVRLRERGRDLSADNDFDIEI